MMFPEVARRGLPSVILSGRVSNEKRPCPVLRTERFLFFRLCANQFAQPLQNKNPGRWPGLLSFVARRGFEPLTFGL